MGLQQPPARIKALCDNRILRISRDVMPFNSHARARFDEMNCRMVRSAATAPITHCTYGVYAQYAISVADDLTLGQIHSWASCLPGWNAVKPHSTCKWYVPLHRGS
jgi:hypothetical protein